MAILAYLDLLRPRNWNDIVPLSKKPGEAHLPRGRILLLSEILQALDELKDVGKVFLAKPGLIRNSDLAKRIFLVILTLESFSSIRRLECHHGISDYQGL